MVFAISGASGFIGKSIRQSFNDETDEHLVLGRNESTELWEQKISKADVLINLAGHPVLCRWNNKNKRKILESRVNTTRKIVEILNTLPTNASQKLLISASAIGIYPDDVHFSFDEKSNAVGGFFLAKVVTEWELEALKTNSNVRLVIARLGVVLGKESATMRKLLPMFRLGLGGVIASGKQKMSFIHVADVVRVLRFFIENQTCSGTYNLVAPNAPTNKAFTTALAAQLQKPAFLPVPAFALSIIYGNAARLLVKGSEIKPTRLIEEKFEFKYPTIEDALAEICS